MASLDTVDLSTAGVAGAMYASQPAAEATFTVGVTPGKVLLSVVEPAAGDHDEVEAGVFFDRAGLEQLIGHAQSMLALL